MVILLDNKLTDGFGYELCLELKKNPTTRKFPVILVSAVNQLANIAEESGADGYLNKPFDLVELTSIVRSFS